MELKTLKRNFPLRRELHLALLAAMETCLVYAIILFLATLAQTPRVLTPLPFFAAYWLALIVGRALPQSRKHWVILQVMAILIAFVTMFAVARAELYPLFDWYDWGWLSRYVPTLISFTKSIAAEHIVSAGVLYVFIRGLGLAQRPLTLWFVGLQFRIGVVVFFFLLLVASYLKSYDASPWIFAYFGFSLLAIALARLEEMGSDLRLGPRWAVTLLAAVALVLFLGLGILQFFTVETARILLLLLTPLWMLAGLIFLLIAIPAGLLAAWIAETFRPLFERLRQALEAFRGLFPADLAKTLEQAQGSIVALPFLEPLVKAILTLAVLLTVGYLLARALNRRMKRTEEEAYLRESLGAGDDAALARRAAMKKAKPRPRVHHIAAESIRRIYAALVARAAEAGLPRRVAETPYEFLPRLEQCWQDEADDLRAITEAYVAVHYAEHRATPEQVSHVRAAWERIKRKKKNVKGTPT